MKHPILPAAFVAAFCVAAPQPGLASAKGWDTASSIGAYGLSAVAIGLPLAKHDGKGALQAGGSLAAAQIVTIGLKEAFPEVRPDGSDRKSFPSGHTSQSFAAAATLYNREGASIGIPAMLVATFVGVARVKADKHHWYDCVAGAGIGLAAGFVITHRRTQAQSAFIPWGDSHGGGITYAARF
jgi:membrane-associated phospholipid phosphatase